MRAAIISCLYLLTVLSSCNPEEKSITDEKAWPVIKSYEKEHLTKIALPLGGIATGTIMLSGNGELTDWEIFKYENSVPEKIVIDAPSFTIFTNRGSEPPETKSLFAIKDEPGRNFSQSGVPGFEKATFDAAYPFGQVHLTDNKMPVAVTIRAFNPLAPCEPLLSGLPVAILDYEIKNTDEKKIIVSVAGTMGSFAKPAFRNSGYYKGIFTGPDSTFKADQHRGSVALSVLGEQKVNFSRFNGFDEFLNEFSDDGELTESVIDADNRLMASLAIKDTLAPGETRNFRFMLSWYFPVEPGSSMIGTHYATVFTNAWNIIEETGPYLASLEKQSILFVRTLMNSGLPNDVIEAALFNLSSLRSKPLPFSELMKELPEDQNTARNYEQAASFLFGSIANDFREGELNAAIGSNLSGGSSLENKMALIMNFYRDWQLSGDSAFITRNWPGIRKLLMSLWQPKAPDDNKDGVILSPDSAYNPKLQILYLGALRAAQEMSSKMNDTDIGLTAGKLFLQGSEWTDIHLFNGNYYEHRANDPDDHTAGGCLPDQLAGQFISHICGLGHLVNRKNIRRSYKSITKHDSTYMVSAGMFYEGMHKDGLKTIQSIKAGYDGSLRNPFIDEEYGMNYGGPAAWATLIALTGFQYSAVDKVMSINVNSGSAFWSTGYGWGSVTVKGKGRIKDVTINVYGGKLFLNEFILSGYGKRILSEKNPSLIKEGQSRGFSVLAGSL